MQKSFISSRTPPFFRWKGDPDHHQQGVAPPPADPNAPGAGGKPYKVSDSQGYFMK